MFIVVGGVEHQDLAASCLCGLIAKSGERHVVAEVRIGESSIYVIAVGKRILHCLLRDVLCRKGARTGLGWIRRALCLRAKEIVNVSHMADQLCKRSNLRRGLEVI